MNVSLTPQLEAMIREQVASGRYNNASEVVRDALRRMEAREQKLIRLRGLLQEGLDSGEPIEWTPERHGEILARAKAAVARGERPKPDVCP